MNEMPFYSLTEHRRRAAMIRRIRFDGALRVVELLLSCVDPDSDEADELLRRKRALEGLR